MFTPEEVEKLQKADRELNHGWTSRANKGKKSAHLNFKITQQTMDNLDKLVSSGVFFNRSEAVRYMITDYFVNHRICLTCGEMVSITD